MNTEHFVWIIAQVPPCKAAIMSKIIVFWRTCFLIRDISVFGKDRHCQLSFKACWVNIVRAFYLISSRAVEGTKMVAKWSYQWKTEHAHLAFKSGRLAALGTWPDHAHHPCWPEIAPSGIRRWTGQDMPNQDPSFLLSFNGVCSTTGIVPFNRSSLQQDNRILVEIESTPSLRGAKLLTHPDSISHCKFT